MKEIRNPRIVVHQTAARFSDEGNPCTTIHGSRVLPSGGLTLATPIRTAEGDVEINQ